MKGWFLLYLPIHIASVLLQLISIPDALQKRVMALYAMSRSLLWLSPIKIPESSTNWFRVRNMSECGTCIPCILFPSKSSWFLIAIARPCITSEKTSGYKLSPCLPPPGSGNVLECFPLIMHAAVVWVNPSFAYLMNSGCMFIACIILKVNWWSTDSRLDSTLERIL